ncbi:hypothetical protein C8034_v008087 [Colletotrichum sidae]|uniref:Uncharacterized protein n=1 Tax=Colletotrichum sidae TaxID=1347389 RepID=A0A4R8TQ36_9PEZI|nr:hypothetical protein C8034_v008087 [Colletotrichum sidae]
MSDLAKELDDLAKSMSAITISRFVATGPSFLKRLPTGLIARIGETCQDYDSTTGMVKSRGDLCALASTGRSVRRACYSVLFKDVRRHVPEAELFHALVAVDRNQKIKEHIRTFDLTTKYDIRSGVTGDRTNARVLAALLKDLPDLCELRLQLEGSKLNSALLKELVSLPATMPLVQTFSYGPQLCPASVADFDFMPKSLPAVRRLRLEIAMDPPSDVRVINASLQPHQTVKIVPFEAAVNNYLRELPLETLQLRKRDWTVDELQRLVSVLEPMSKITYLLIDGIPTAPGLGWGDIFIMFRGLRLKYLALRVECNDYFHPQAFPKVDVDDGNWITPSDRTLLGVAAGLFNSMPSLRAVFVKPVQGQQKVRRCLPEVKQDGKIRSRMDVTFDPYTVSSQIRFHLNQDGFPGLNFDTEA